LKASSPVLKSAALSAAAASRQKSAIFFTSFRSLQAPDRSIDPHSKVGIAIGRDRRIMLVAGSWECEFQPPPRVRLPAALTAPQDPYCDPSKQAVDDFYQHLEHRLLLSAPQWRPGLISRAFLFEALVLRAGTRSPMLPEKERTS
jgi:hypothetical protein